MKKFLWPFIFTLTSIRLWAIDTICYDAHNAFSFSAPEFFFADTKSADQLGLCVIYIPKKTTFDNAPVILYPRVVTTPLSLASFIEKDKKDFLKKAVTAFIEKQHPYLSKSKLQFEVRFFHNGPPPNEYELVYYLKAKKAVLLLGLSARKKSDLIKYEISLKNLADGIASVKKLR